MAKTFKSSISTLNNPAEAFLTPKQPEEKEPEAKEPEVSDPGELKPRKGRGRPAKPEAGANPLDNITFRPANRYKETRSKRIPFVATPSLKEKLVKAAQEEETSVNDLIHKVLEVYLANRES